jgi:hypothetical protein
MVLKKIITCLMIPSRDLEHFQVSQVNMLLCVPPQDLTRPWTRVLEDLAGDLKSLEDHSIGVQASPVPRGNK